MTTRATHGKRPGEEGSAIQPVSRTKVIFVELNEAERYFLDKLVDQGKLPTFREMIGGGAMLRTNIPEWDAGKDRAWRHISPWMVWPSVYTGMRLDEHNLVGFGQDPAVVRGKCLWDVLDDGGVSVGILGSLMSFPPRTAGNARFYVPESLADDAACFPDDARPLQEFCVFSARSYSEDFAAKAVTATRLLLKTRRSGVRLTTILRTLAQVPLERLLGPRFIPERAMLHSYLTVDAFEHLLARHAPAYSSVHLNHVAYMQHRYWRAAEPERFKDELSTTDRRFFSTVDARRHYESKLSSWIERSFIYTDGVLRRLIDRADPETIILVGTALGQRPLDPVDQIHNPVVRLVRERELFDALGISDYTVLHQMNPDVTLNLPNEQQARTAETALLGLYVHDDRSLFTVLRRGRQLFLELDMPRRRAAGEPLLIKNRARPEWQAPFERHIEEQDNNDQSTAHHKDSGWLLAYSKGRKLEASRGLIRVTEIAPMILSWYGIAPPSWMDTQAPAVQIAA